MNLLLFILAIFISVVVVRIGAVAFNLTGMEWTQAKFQALSCFSGTGYTTREAEMIVSHRTRRRIASTLMILGNAGLVTLIATFANSINTRGISGMLEIPFLHIFFPATIVPLVNLAIIALILIIFAKIFGGEKLRRRMTRYARRVLIKKQLVQEVTFEELLIAGGDYGVTRLHVGMGCPIVGQTLLDAKLRQQDITVLVIERRDKVIPNPGPYESVREADHLICFGKLENIRSLAHNLIDSAQSAIEEHQDDLETTI